MRPASTPRSRHPGRRLTLLSALGLIMIASPAMADYAPMPQADLIERSTLIVTATFVGSQAMRPMTDGAPIQVGVLRVMEVLKGDITTRIALLRVPRSGPGALRASDDIVFQPDQTGLWYLRSLPDGLYAADHPARFVPVDQAQDQIQALRRR